MDRTRVFGSLWCATSRDFRADHWMLTFVVSQRFSARYVSFGHEEVFHLSFWGCWLFLILVHVSSYKRHSNSYVCKTVFILENLGIVLLAYTRQGGTHWVLQ